MKFTYVVSPKGKAYIIEVSDAENAREHAEKLGRRVWEVVEAMVSLGMIKPKAVLSPPRKYLKWLGRSCARRYPVGS